MCLFLWGAFPAPAPEIFRDPLYNGIMIKRILALIVLVGFVGFVVVTSWPGFQLPSLDFIFESASYSEDPDIQRHSRAVVRIGVLYQDDDGFGAAFSTGRKSGTGFNVDPHGLVVTNHHVVSGAAGVTVTFPEGPSYPARTWRSLPELDLAVIDLGRENLPALRWAPGAAPAPGERVTIIGNPLGLQSIVTRGTVETYLRVDGIQTRVMVMSNIIHEGNSGSPVINDRQEVVGVVFGSLTFETDAGPATAGLAVPMEAAADFIRGAGADFTP